jgi:hypothetical protein
VVCLGSHLAVTLTAELSQGYAVLSSKEVSQLLGFVRNKDIVENCLMCLWFAQNVWD